MNFGSEAEYFLDEFAEDFTAGGAPFRAIFDSPTDSIELSGIGSNSTQFKLTLATASITLKRGDKVTHCETGAVYEVREPAIRFDDGVFSEILLTKVPS